MFIVTESERDVKKQYKNNFITLEDRHVRTKTQTAGVDHYCRIQEERLFEADVVTSVTVSSSSTRHPLNTHVAHTTPYSDLCHLQHKLIGFYNRDEKCLQRGTDWVFKYRSLRFVFKWLSENKQRLVPLTA